MMTRSMKMMLRAKVDRPSRNPTLKNTCATKTTMATTTMTTTTTIWLPNGSKEAGQEEAVFGFQNRSYGVVSGFELLCFFVDEEIMDLVVAAAQTSNTAKGD